jgi:nucleotide-binding universal stress UspA family protein
MYRKILVVVDDRKVTESAIWQAIEMAKVHRADLMLFHVLPRFEVLGLDIPGSLGATPEEFEKQVTEKATARLAAASAAAESEGVHSFRAMGFGEDDAKCVADAAALHHCDLIVVGTEGRNALVRLLMGNIVQGLITAASVPLLVCKELDETVKPGRRSKIRIHQPSQEPSP